MVAAAMVLVPCKNDEVPINFGMLLAIDAIEMRLVLPMNCFCNQRNCICEYALVSSMTWSEIGSYYHDCCCRMR